MKKKYLIQSLLITFEILLVPGLLTLCSNLWAKVTDLNDLLTRFITFTAVYEFLVYLINKNQLDVRKDSLMSYKLLINQSLLLIEYPEFNFLKEELLNKISNLNDDSYYFIHNDVLDAINTLKTAIDTNKIFKMKSYLEAELIWVEHKIQVEDLSWNNTLLLKIFK